MSKLRKLSLNQVLILLLILQVCFSLSFKNKLPVWENIPPPLQQDVTSAISLGDDEFMYRLLGLRLQNLGDASGKNTALAKYDYKLLSQWFYSVSYLNPYSSYVPATVAFYYSQTPRRLGAIYVTEFLRQYFLGDPERRWRWMAHAVYLAKHKIKTMPYALELAEELASYDIPNEPLWVKQMPSFILRDMGKKDEARQFMISIMQEDKNISPQELLFMQDYINKHLQ